MYLILNKDHFTFHLQYKHSGTFANHKHEELCYPKNQKLRDLILVTLVKMWPHDSPSSSENATPSSGTSPIASYKEVPPPPPPPGRIRIARGICSPCSTSTHFRAAQGCRQDLWSADNLTRLKENGGRYRWKMFILSSSVSFYFTRHKSSNLRR